MARPGAREAASNLGWLAAEKIARFVLNVGVGFWVARHLGPADFGRLSFALAVVGIVLPLADMGIEAVVRREFIRSPEKAPALAAVGRGVRLAAGGAGAILLLLSLLFPWAEAGEGKLVAVFALMLFQPALMMPDMWLQANLRARLSVLMQVSALAIGAALRVWLIFSDAPLVGFAWAAVAESALAAGLLTMSARRVGFRFGKFDRALAARLVRETWPLLLSGLAVLLYMRIDVLMLRRMAGDSSVGIYSAATRFTEIWYFLPGALAASLLPALLRARDAGGHHYARRFQKFYDINAALAYALAVPTALAASWLIRVAYGSAFAEAAPVLVIQVWSLVFVFLGVARGQFLVNEGHTGIYLGATVAGLLINVGLNLVLIPASGARGAALATLAAQAVAAWLSSFCFAPVRPTAWMQTRALLIPMLWYRYVRRT